MEQEKHDGCLEGELARVLGRMLSPKQKQVLVIVCEVGQGRVVTQIVPLIAQQLLCAVSTAWNHLLFLKEIGMIDFGDFSSKGKPIYITELGRVFLEVLKDEKQDA